MNYLLPQLNDYFSEITNVIGRTWMSENFLIARGEQMADANQNYYGGSMTTYRDLSIAQGQHNLFAPEYDYDVDNNNLEAEVLIMISQINCLAVSQTYEIFETYLIEIITEFLIHNPKYFSYLKILEPYMIDIVSDFLIKNEHNKKGGEYADLHRKYIRNGVKKNQDTNNRGLLRFIRKCSPHFAKHEIDNLFEKDMSVWFDVLTMTRHTLVHNRQVISKRFFTYLDQHGFQEIFDKYFAKKTIDGKPCIFLDKHSAQKIITPLNSYAHLIFVGLSQLDGLPLRVKQHQ